MESFRPRREFDERACPLAIALPRPHRIGFAGRKWVSATVCRDAHLARETTRSFAKCVRGAWQRGRRVGAERAFPLRERPRSAHCRARRMGDQGNPRTAQKLRIRFVRIARTTTRKAGCCKKATNETSDVGPPGA